MRKSRPHAFKFDVPEDAKLLSRFLPPPPPSPLAAVRKKAEEFTFVDYSTAAASAASR